MTHNVIHFASISAARHALAAEVIIWHQHRLGGHRDDAYLWLAERGGEVLDYNTKANLLSEYPSGYCLTIHRDGAVTATANTNAAT